MGAIDLRTSASPAATADLILQLFGRHLVELAIESLIDRLDATDGDLDAEDGDQDCCVAGDDGIFSGGLTGPLPGWAIGSDEDEEEDDPPGGNIDDVPHDQDHEAKPIYGFDQSKGPTNGVELLRAHHLTMLMPRPAPFGVSALHRR